MKKLGLAVLMALCAVGILLARDIDPVVNSDWLAANAGNPRLVVVDVRAMDAYKAGHIPGAVSMIGASVYVKKGDINNEVPEMDELSDLLSAAGIKADSLVVVVEAEGGARFPWATRVAWTFKYAGIENVSVLDGGFKAWTAAGKPTQTDMVKATASGYKAKAVPMYFADKAAVLGAKSAQIVDARAYDTYFGMSKQAFVAQAGHFTGAYPLPFSWIYGADGMVKPKAELEALAAKLGLNPATETIIYCDSGVLCTAWWYVFSEMFGWKNVRSFDGSSQVLAADPSVKYVTLTWR